MTRTGKSNTIKTLDAVYKHGTSPETRIGQLIFDPQGEYANVNERIRLGCDCWATVHQVRVYKERPDPSEPIERALRINFLDPATLSTVWAMVQQEVAESSSSGAQYMAGFRGVSIGRARSQRLRRAEPLRTQPTGLLRAAGTSRHIRVAFSSTRVTLSATLIGDLPVGPAIPNLTTRGNHAYLSHTSAAKALLEWLQQQNAANSAHLSQSWKDDFNTGELADILKAMEGRAGDAAIKRLKPFHDPAAIGDIGELVWDDMVAGRLVIIDLSQGNGTVGKDTLRARRLYAAQPRPRRLRGGQEADAVPDRG